MKVMSHGGNENARVFFRKHGLDPSAAASDQINRKYNSRAAVGLDGRIR